MRVFIHEFLYFYVKRDLNLCVNIKEKLFVMCEELQYFFM